MSILPRFSIVSKLTTIVLFSVSAFLFYGVGSYTSLVPLRINGDLYKEIILGKDLVADVLPPPEYIIESYLTVAHLATERDSVEIVQLRTTLQALDVQYQERRAFWLQTLPAGPLKDALTVESYLPVAQFQACVNQEFLPALATGNQAKALDLLHNRLKVYYDAHRIAIDKVVKLANEEGMAREKRAAETSDSFVKRFIIIGALLLAALLIVSVFVGRTILVPLGKSIAYVRKLADGNGSEGIQHLEVTSNDELGDLFREFNRFIDKTQRDIGVAAKQITDLTAKQKLLSGKMGKTILENDLQTTNGIEAISRLEDYTKDLTASSEKMAGSISTIATAAEEISTNINTVASTSEEISTTMVSVAATAEEMSINFTMVDGAVKELSLAITGVAQNAREGTTVADNASVVAKDTSELMGLLGKSANEIGKVTSVIQVIAKQTNLLALNAAIEAASAGDAGRGFAVVANEVKELAKQTATATEDISARIERIQGDTQRAVAAIQHISSIIGTINNLQKLISGMVETQTTATANISRNITEASTGSGEIARRIAEAAHASKEVSHNINEIAQGANVVARNIAGAAKAVGEVNERVSGSYSLAETTAGIMEKSKQAAITFTHDMKDMLSSLDEVSASVDQLNKVLKSVD